MTLGLLALGLFALVVQAFLLLTLGILARFCLLALGIGALLLLLALGLLLARSVLPGFGLLALDAGVAFLLLALSVLARFCLLALGTLACALLMLGFGALLLLPTLCLLGLLLARSVLLGLLATLVGLGLVLVLLLLVVAVATTAILRGGGRTHSKRKRGA
ncbi:hypothetical protein CSC74_01900 [Pseudoxanthomonas yeongjuensis]|uniref:hypothetical protein n=1 Tax=Pseudoxanthomonas yeongjuensis TaxID=377616 RepID=UPI001391E86F|nr:hypothetical protein [Pseudoxanthomonas yeongjuensis]KAF1717699.1 hypothetical protein CSC74_01900 [Pseudoxanthomonas yeongjuensis]